MPVSCLSHAWITCENQSSSMFRSSITLLPCHANFRTFNSKNICEDPTTSFPLIEDQQNTTQVEPQTSNTYSLKKNSRQYSFTLKDLFFKNIRVDQLHKVKPSLLSVPNPQSYGLCEIGV